MRSAAILVRMQLFYVSSLKMAATASLSGVPHVVAWGFPVWEVFANLIAKVRENYEVLTCLVTVAVWVLSQGDVILQDTKQHCANTGFSSNFGDEISKQTDRHFFYSVYSF
jgi:hypothetical protein